MTLCSKCLHLIVKSWWLFGRWEHVKSGGLHYEKIGGMPIKCECPDPAIPTEPKKEDLGTTASFEHPVV